MPFYAVKGENRKRYQRMAKKYVLFSTLDFAIALLEISPPDLTWLVEPALTPGPRFKLDHEQCHPERSNGVTYER